jgi:hypothetical protein
MDAAVVSAIITAASTLLVAVMPRLWASIRLSSVSPLAFGAFITGVIGLVGLVGQMDGINQGLVAIADRLDPIEESLQNVENSVPEIRDLVAPLSRQVTAIADRQTAGPREPSFDELTEAPQPDESAELTRHAQAILDGSGRREWRLDDGTTIGLEASFYISDSFWFPVAISALSDDGTPRDGDRCITVNGGRLIVRGFSVERQAALVEYQPPSGRGFGTSCSAGTHFFYPLPAVN